MANEVFPPAYDDSNIPPQYGGFEGDEGANNEEGAYESYAGEEGADEGANNEEGYAGEEGYAYGDAEEGAEEGADEVYREEEGAEEGYGEDEGAEEGAYESNGDSLFGGFRPVGDSDDEGVAADYHELKQLFDDVYPFHHAGSKEMSIREKFDKDVATPYLFGRLVGGSLSLDQAKRLGDQESRRKLYRELTSLFQ